MLVGSRISDVANTWALHTRSELQEMVAVGSIWLSAAETTIMRVISFRLAGRCHPELVAMASIALVAHVATPAAGKRPYRSVTQLPHTARRTAVRLGSVVTF